MIMYYAQANKYSSSFSLYLHFIIFFVLLGALVQYWVEVVLADVSAFLKILVKKAPVF